MDGVSQFLQHDVQRGVLRQFHHEHTRLHPDVARVRLTWRGGGTGQSVAATSAPELFTERQKADEIRVAFSVHTLGDTSVNLIIGKHERAVCFSQKGTQGKQS